MRWRILAILFFARLTMAYQFAFVGALAPLYQASFGVTAGQVGFLIGLYFLPGVLIALPGGTLGAWFDDKRVVLFAMVLMAIGGAIMAGAGTWHWQVTGRVMAGVGGVIVNVLMTKMVADWFADGALSTAMGLFTNSWPAGIALALVSAPLIGDTAGLAAAAWALFALILLGLLAVAFGYRSPQTTGANTRGRFPRGPALASVLFAGSAWGLFNAGYAMAFSFGPANLVARGFTLVEASAITSIIVWATIPCGFIGGALADWSGRPLTLLYTAWAVLVGALVAFPHVEQVVVLALVLGIATGLPVGIALGQGTRALQPGERAIGMGLFFTLYFVFFSAAPALISPFVDRTGSTDIAIYFGAFLVVLALVATTAAALAIERAQASWSDG